jgi:hypothetical protein
VTCAGGFQRYQRAEDEALLVDLGVVDGEHSRGDRAREQSQLPLVRGDQRLLHTVLEQLSGPLVVENALDDLLGCALGGVEKLLLKLARAQLRRTLQLGLLLGEASVASFPEPTFGESDANQYDQCPYRKVPSHRLCKHREPEQHSHDRQ